MDVLMGLAALGGDDAVLRHHCRARAVVGLDLASGGRAD
jgi:hypothetical protein